MMNFLQLLMKRPTDLQIRYAKIILGIVLIALGIIAFGVQNLSLESSFFGINLDPMTKKILAYIIVALGVFPLVMGGLDINILSRGRTRILQVIFGVLLMFVSGLFLDTASLTVDIFYFILGLIVAIAGITGKAITKKGLKTGQKITKIRV
ncbi:hypothetical protein GW846_05950 [Candidatus Gracilibacteria bacterium]|nr:hypothetical protein [Candidatus Gracilibacteria bacterium]